MFTPRTIRPEAGNKYYIRRASGGYSTAIIGKPADPDCDVLANCVGYAVGRFHEIAQRPAFDLIAPVNAENLYANAQARGLRTGDTPELGALIIWAKGKAGNSADGAGHVAVIERIAADGTITTSESEYGGRAFVVRTYKPPYAYAAGYKLLGFVYQPSANPFPEPARVLRKGSVGSDVKWLQQELIVSGYLRPNELDGIFGTITLCGVAGFQLEHALEVDGVCGPMTRSLLKKEY